MNIETFILGFFSAVIFGGLPYVLWRYAYVPFKVTRKDIVALNERMNKADEQREADQAWLRNEIGLRKAASLSDEELAQREMKLRARKLWPVAQTNQLSGLG